MHDSCCPLCWELPEDSQFPSVALDLPEAMKYASLWVTKDAQHIKHSKIFYILMEMNMRMDINRNPLLSPTVFSKLHEYVEFKENFQRISIRESKDPKQKWHDLPYLATNDAINAVLDHWLAEWHTASDSAVGSRKSAV